MVDANGFFGSLNDEEFKKLYQELENYTRLRETEKKDQIESEIARKIIKPINCLKCKKIMGYKKGSNNVNIYCIKCGRIEKIKQ